MQNTSKAEKRKVNMKHESTKFVEILNDIVAEYNNAIERFNTVSDEVARDVESFKDEVLTEFMYETSYIQDIVTVDKITNISIDLDTFYQCTKLRDSFYDALMTLILTKYNEVTRKGA